MSLVPLLWPDNSLPQHRDAKHSGKMQFSLQKQAGLGWLQNHPIGVVLSIPNPSLFFPPCCLFSSVETFKGTRHSKWSLSDSRIGLTLTAPSSSPLAPCLCVSDRPPDPCYDFISLFVHPMLWRQLCPKHNPAAPKGRCLPHWTCSRHSLLKRTNIPHKRRTKRTHQAPNIRVGMKQDFSNRREYISCLAPGTLCTQRFLFGLWVLQLVFPWSPSWQVWLCDVGQ